MPTEFSVPDPSAKVSSALNDIVTKARQVDELVAEVASASVQQNQGISQIASSVGQMDKITQSNAASAEQSAAAAQELNSQSKIMTTSVQELLHMVDEHSNGTSTQQYLGEPGASRPVASIAPGFSGRAKAKKEPSVVVSTGPARQSLPMEGDFGD